PTPLLEDGPGIRDPRGGLEADRAAPGGGRGGALRPGRRPRRVEGPCPRPPGPGRPPDAIPARGTGPRPVIAPPPAPRPPRLARRPPRSYPRLALVLCQSCNLGFAEAESSV